MNGGRHSDRFSNCVGSRTQPTSIARLIFNASLGWRDWPAVFVKDGATRPRVDRIVKRRTAGRPFSNDKGPDRCLKGFFAVTLELEADPAIGTQCLSPPAPSKKKR